MKKSIIAPMALAGVAMAETYTSSTPVQSYGAQGNYYGFTLAPNNDTFLTNDIPDDITALTLDSITLQSRNDNASDECPDIKVAVYAYSKNNTVDTYLGVSTNSTGTAAVNTTYTLNFSGITINPNECYQFLYVKADTDATTLATFEGYQAASTSWGTAVTNSFSTNIPDGWGTYKNNKLNSWEGQYIPVTTVTLSTPVVPEPTTATLSLLALAGLAARRRRASR